MKKIFCRSGSFVVGWGFVSRMAGGYVVAGALSWPSREGVVAGGFVCIPSDWITHNIH